MGDEDGELPSLADTIAAVQRELSVALAVGPGPLARFRAGPVELDLEVAVTGGGQAGVRLWVLPLGGTGGRPPAGTQRIKIALLPLAPVTGDDGQVTMPADRPVQAEGLEVHEVDDGLVVYQAQPECVHHLNNTAAVVFELCDGQNTIPDISEQLASAFGLDEAAGGIAEKCIAELRDKSVIV